MGQPESNGLRLVSDFHQPAKKETEKLRGAQLVAGTLPYPEKQI